MTKSSMAVNKAAEKKTIPSDTFTANGIKYKFVAYAFILDGKEITASEALKNEVVLATLVKIKSGVIEAIGEEQKTEE